MSDAEYQRRYFKKRYAQDPEFRAHRKEVGNDYRRRRYADDPEFRSGCLRAARNSRLKQQYGITVDDYEAAFAPQRGACGCCHQKLGRVIRIDRPEGIGVALLCTPCIKRVAGQRNDGSGWPPLRDHGGLRLDARAERSRGA
jgi:hypothetical protein